jgi:hypothetical protein
MYLSRSTSTDIYEGKNEKRNRAKREKCSLERKERKSGHIAMVLSVKLFLQ